MEKNETQKKQINEADYIDIIVFVRAFLRLALRYLLLVCPIIVCLTVGMNLLSRALVREQYVAEGSFVVGATLSDDFSYNYTEIRDDYVMHMSEAFRSIIEGDYMFYLLVAFVHTVRNRLGIGIEKGRGINSLYVKSVG